MVEGQKVNFTISTVGSNYSCSGSAKIESLGILGTIPSNNFTTTWNINGVLKTTNTVSGLCQDKIYSVNVTSEQGCTATKKFSVPFCQPQPLNIFPVNTNKIPLNQYTDKIHEEFVYCDKTNAVHVQIEGGTPPIKYTFTKPNNVILQSGIITIPSGQSLKNYWRTVVLKQDKDFKKGKYVFEAEDACGNKQKFEFDCTCNYDYIPIRFMHYNSCSKDGKAEIKLTKEYYSPLGGFGFTLPSQTYEIEWCEKTPASVTKVRIDDFNGAFGKMSIISGNGNFIGKPEIECGITITNQYGCKYVHCIDFDIKDGEKYNYCFPVIRSIQGFNPNTNFKAPFNQTNAITNKFANRDLECEDACVDGRENPILEVLAPGKFSYKEGTYIPQDYTKPCAYGTLQYPCQNNLNKYESIDIVPFGAWYEDIDAKSIRPSQKPLFIGLCEVDAYCYFPVGSLSANNFYPDRPKYFKTTRVLDKNFKCNEPIPANNPLISYGGTWGFSPLTTSANCKEPLIITDKGDCLYDFTCPSTGKVEIKDEYLPNHCILGEFYTNSCAGIQDLCEETCDVSGFIQYFIVRYCDIDDLCGSKPLLNIVKTDIVPIGHTAGSKPKPGDAKKISYNYYNPLSNRTENIKACFPNAFFKEDLPDFKNTKNNKDAADKSFKVFPNPFENNLNIRMNTENSEIITIQLVNLLGQVTQVEKKDLMKGLNEFNLNLKDNIPSGIYYLQITGKDYKLQYPIVHQ